MEAGAQWPELVAGLVALQPNDPSPWTIRQKQTGANRLCLGGAVSANIHGRGLVSGPIVGDIESLTVIGPRGELDHCSRDENRELFRSVIGGYGLFGAVATVTLRLTRRSKVRRHVEVVTTDEAIPTLERRIADGYRYGDFQFAVDRRATEFLREGVCACYLPVADGTPVTQSPVDLSASDWERLIFLAHTDPSRAYRLYVEHYGKTSGQVYFSDTQQMSDYIDDYHLGIDRLTGATSAGSEMITEAYVPRSRLADFLAAVRDDFQRHGVELIYGTVRLVEAEHETFLNWACEPWACTIFNLHVQHSPAGLDRSRNDFRRLIDLALTFDGCYYLTYHRWATREQVERAYPQMAEFLARKRRHDSSGVFANDWFRHMKAMMADGHAI